MYIERNEVYEKLKHLPLLTISEIVRDTYKDAMIVNTEHWIFGGAKRREWFIQSSISPHITYSPVAYSEADAWKYALERIIRDIW